MTEFTFLGELILEGSEYFRTALFNHIHSTEQQKFSTVLYLCLLHVTHNKD